VFPRMCSPDTLFPRICSPDNVFPRMCSLDTLEFYFARRFCRMALPELVHMPDRFVLEGMHLDSGRLINIVIRNRPQVSPNRLLSIVQNMPGAQRFSLDAFAKCIGSLGPTWAQALGKILGDPDFVTKHNVAPSAVLRFDHLVEQYPNESDPLEFKVMHKRELDERLAKADVVHFIAVDGNPYFIGDFKKARPTGVLELATTVRLRDIVWLDEEHVIAGPQYFWHDQYLDEIRTSYEARSKTQATIQRILYNQVLRDICEFGEADSQLDPSSEERACNLGDVVLYRRGGRYVDMIALEIASRPSHEVYVVGPGRHIVRRGMGVQFDLPVWLRSAIHAPNIPSSASFLDRVFGCITGFKQSLDPRNPVNVTIAVHLDRSNLPAWLLSRLNDAHLLQTNREMMISERYITGVFSIWPPPLFQGTCAPGPDSDRHVNDRVVVGHIEICKKDTGLHPEDSRTGSSAGDADTSDLDTDSRSVSSDLFYREDGLGQLRLFPHVRDMIDPIIALHDGRAFVEVSVVSPLRASCALECLHDQNILFNQVAFPYAFTDAYCKPSHFRPSLRQVIVAGPRDILHQASLSFLRGILQGQSDERC